MKTGETDFQPVMPRRASHICLPGVQLSLPDDHPSLSKLRVSNFVLSSCIFHAPGVLLVLCVRHRFCLSHLLLFCELI